MLNTGDPIPTGSIKVAGGDGWSLTRIPGVKIGEHGSLWPGLVMTFRDANGMVAWGHSMSDVLEGMITSVMGVPWRFRDLPDDAKHAVLLQFGFYHKWLFPGVGKDSFSGWLLPEAEAAGLFVYRVHYNTTKGWVGLVVSIGVTLSLMTPRANFPTDFHRTGLPVYEVYLSPDGSNLDRYRFPLTRKQEGRAMEFDQAKDASVIVRKAMVRQSGVPTIAHLFTDVAIAHLRQECARYLLTR